MGNKLKKILCNFKLKEFFNSEIENEVKKYNLENNLTCIFPIEIAELRIILLRNEISHFDSVPVFSSNFASKNFKDYSLYLEYDLNSLKRKYDIDFSLGAIGLISSKKIKVNDLLRRIIVNEPVADGGYEKVKNILTDCNLKIDIIVSNCILEKKKISQSLNPGEIGQDVGELKLDKEIVVGPNHQDSKYKEGMKVKKRNSKNIFNKDVGIISSKKNNLIEITWNPKSKKEKKEVYDVVNDISFLEAYLVVLNR